MLRGEVNAYQRRSLIQHEGENIWKRALASRPREPG
jgi:hypothetical protein